MNRERAGNDISRTDEALFLMGTAVILLDSEGEALAAAHVQQAIDCLVGPRTAASNDD